jgi:hypothetical protein
MRFLMTIRAAGAPTPEQGAAIGAFMRQMASQGVMLTAGGLTAPRMRVSARGGSPSVTDAPFAEAKEIIGGFAVIDAASFDEAVQLAGRFAEVADAEVDVHTMTEATGPH